MNVLKNVLEFAEMIQQGYTFSPKIRNGKGETIKPFKITDANGNDVTTDFELKSVGHCLIKYLHFQRENLFLLFQNFLDKNVEYYHLFEHNDEGYCIGIIASDLNIEEMYAHIAEHFKNEYKIEVSFEGSLWRKEKCKLNHTFNEYLFKPYMDIIKPIS